MTSALEDYGRSLRQQWSGQAAVARGTRSGENAMVACGLHALLAQGSRLLVPFFDASSRGESSSFFNTTEFGHIITLLLRKW